MRIIVLIVALVCAVSALGQSMLAQLMPRPQHIEVREGVYHGNPDAAIVEIVSAEDLGTYDYPLPGFDNEGYRLSITTSAVRITAASDVGVIRARQTLAQLISDDGTIECAEITDYPAFKYRGWMHDVGRSYITIDELKREIENLSRFKVNVFHWHLTDNQGFRFESLSHPELNSRGYERFDGKYYTQRQCRELEAFAAQRGMVIIPEIDMPGHSRSFEAATGVTMSSPEGCAILRDVLAEVATVFGRAPYIHLGADESGASAAYVRQMSDYVHSLGRKVVCWNRYGGNTLVTPEVMGVDMTTNWATAGTLVSGIPNVDMRYYYANHFDLFADVAGVYRSNIFGVERGDSAVAGVSVGVWNDRMVSDERQIVAQNNLYAVLLAVTERAWLGGGKAYIEDGGAYLPTSGEEYEAFVDWERRFLYYKDKWLGDEPIAYVRQTDVRWNITPAYDNGGDPQRVFEPETMADLVPLPGSIDAVGAGQWLNHIWAGTVAGTLGQAAQPFNQTRYAWTYVYSPIDQNVGALIELRNYSRSDDGQVPPNGAWDIMASRVWINDDEILPPWQWTGADTNPTLEDDIGNLNIPARKPVEVSLHAGWNKVLLKLPYIDINGGVSAGGRRRGRNNKWMFAFVLTDLGGKHALEDVVYETRPDHRIPLRCHKCISPSR